MLRCYDATRRDGRGSKGRGKERRARVGAREGKGEGCVPVKYLGASGRR